MTMAAACLALVFCFPAAAAEVSGAEAGGPDGFRPATLPPWYLAEGSTYGGMETWVVVQNPNPTPVTVDITFNTNEGKKDGPQGFPVPAQSRRSFFLNSLVPNMKDVSTQVVASGGQVVCERAVYGPGKAWAHESIGSRFAGAQWHLAEGSTYGGMETWVVIQNPNDYQAVVDVSFITGEGKVDGPQDFPIPANSRKSLLLNSLVPNMKDVSTSVQCGTGFVVCERSVYGPGKTWAHESIGFSNPQASWYLAEGSTYGGMETWVVVMNPTHLQAIADVTFHTNEGKVDGPQDFPIPAYSRRSFLLNTLVPNMKDVSTKVVTTGSSVVCERAVYGPGKAWAQGSVGTFLYNVNWYLAEGSTYGGMETWVVVQNPDCVAATVDLTFYTENGKVDGPQDFPIPAYSRRSFLLNTLVPNMKDVSTRVVCDTGVVVCERAVYGPGKAWAHGSVGYGGTL
ncbi:MAG: hypothetical protein H5T73_12595 [Actinobacteria bacterium]|nr:hypothetical protein [Actinomycetota bacterium]